MHERLCRRQKIYWMCDRWSTYALRYLNSTGIAYLAQKPVIPSQNNQARSLNYKLSLEAHNHKDIKSTTQSWRFSHYRSLINFDLITRKPITNMAIFKRSSFAVVFAAMLSASAVSGQTDITFDRCALTEDVRGTVTAITGGRSGSVRRTCKLWS